MYFINVGVSFVYAGMWFTWYVTPCILAMFYPNCSTYTLANAKSASFLKVAHFVHSVHSVMLVFVPSELASVLAPPRSKRVLLSCS